jgi:uncharacterized coiled-coil DUF342 family protein
MSIRDQLTQEAADLRTKANDLNAQAQEIEQKVANLPVELEQIADEAWGRVRDWFKGL